MLAEALFLIAAILALGALHLRLARNSSSDVLQDDLPFHADGIELPPHACAHVRAYRR